MPFTRYPSGLAISAGIWVGFGYFFNGWVEENDRILLKRMTAFESSRARRLLLAEEE